MLMSVRSGGMWLEPLDRRSISLVIAILIWVLVVLYGVLVSDAEVESLMAVCLEKYAAA